MILERFFIRKEAGEPEEKLRVEFAKNEIPLLGDIIRGHIKQIEAHQRTVKGYDKEQRKFMAGMVDPQKLEQERRFLKEILGNLRPTTELARPQLEKILDEVIVRIRDLEIFAKIPKDIKKVMSPENDQVRVSKEAETLIGIRTKIEPLVGRSTQYFLIGI